MLFAQLVLLALGLAMDATAAALTAGFAAPRVRWRDGLLLAGLFGAFQALMPLLGWAVGARFASAIAAWDHWVAFALLGGIGAKMVHEGMGSDSRPLERDPFRLRLLLLLALATSIDALVAGLTLPLLQQGMAVSVAIIGLTTFVLALAGVFLGRKFGDRFGKKLDLAGGLVLIGLGVETLLTHLLA